MNSIEKLIDLELNLHGTKGFIDGLSTNFLIKKCSDSSENGYNLNTLITKVPFKQGSIVFVGNDKYIVLDIEEQFAQNIYYKGTMRKCESFKLSKDKYYKDISTVFGVVDKDKSTLISNDYFLEENTYINVTIPLQQFNINDEYVLYKGKAYMIVNVDDTKDGIVILSSKYKEIYNGKEYDDVYIILLNNISGVLQVGQTLQLVVVCKKNDVIIDNPIVTYISSDNNVATVDNKGLIDCKKDGTVTITCTYEGVSAIYSLEVKQEDVYTIECNNVSIYKGETYQLNPVVKLNGEIIENAKVTYNVEDNSICTCDNGLITSLGIGITKITLYYEDKVQYVVNVTVNKVLVTYNIIGEDKFKQLQEGIFKIEPLRPCKFYIEEFESEYIANIIEDNGNGECKVFGKKNISNNSFILIAMDEEDNILAEKTIWVMR